MKNLHCYQLAWCWRTAREEGDYARGLMRLGGWSEGWRVGGDGGAFAYTLAELFFFGCVLMRRLGIKGWVKGKG